MCELCVPDRHHDEAGNCQTKDDLLIWVYHDSPGYWSITEVIKWPRSKERTMASC